MIRKFKEDDILKIVKLEQDTLGTTLGEEMLKSSLTNSLSYYFVYEIDNSILGYISTNFDGIDVEILNICVNKEYQNKGIGTEILNYIIDYFSNLAKTIILEVRESNERAIHLYKKMGFEQIFVRKNYYSNLENALLMKKKY